MAMTPVTPTIAQNAVTILTAFGLPNASQALHAVESIPGFQDTLQWSSRLASSYIRTSQPVCTTSTTAGKTRKHIVANVTYIYKCTIFPFGKFWGHSGLTSYINYLKALSFYATIQPAVTPIENSWLWNVPIHGHAVMDYWAN